jgi:serine/threonine-protein kinase
MDPAPSSARPRPRLGRYELVARLAAGGMAEVFLARQRGLAGLQRSVVVKRILPHLAADAEFVELFLQEARIVARLSHPNIAQILELGQQGGTWFIAMEYVPGATLRELLAAATQARRPVPVEVAVGLVAQACAGAHAAHELTTPEGAPLGLVHRDISPHNLMVGPDGFVKLLDFGIAKATAASDATRTGGVKGKLQYLAPEQARQEPLDRRSDVFALASTLWELLTGAPPFKRSTDLETLQAIANGQRPALLAVAPQLPPGLAAVIEHALAHDRDARLSSAEDLRRALVQAAFDAGLSAGQDSIAAFVREVLGARLEQTRAALDRALALHPPSGDDPQVPDDTDDFGATSHTLPSLSTLGRSQRRVRRRRALRGAAALLSLLALAFAGVTWWRNRPPEVFGEPLTIGFAPTFQPALIVQELEPLRVYLERETHRPVRIEVAKSYDALADSVVRGDIAFASLPAYLFLRASSTDVPLEPLALEQFDGSSGNDGVLLVLESSGIQGIPQLAGKRLCYTDPSSTTGYVLPRASILAAGLDPDRDLAERRFSGDHLQALLDLNEGRCDAAGTYNGAYLSADRAGVSVARMRVLAITGHSPHDSFVAGPAASIADRLAVREALLAFDPVAHVGQPLLGKVLRISGFRKSDPADFADLRQRLGL